MTRVKHIELRIRICFWAITIDVNVVNLNEYLLSPLILYTKHIVELVCGVLADTLATGTNVRSVEVKANLIPRYRGALLREAPV
ncbi:hypothetical protein C464_17302 [Halorubrum coriense DSM 10284]|uniref:Uncharacterized protein n=1 Tax=Halorubrum coriense DSM 10284 TaxID=1227466 RepID=M0E9W8_9EURY|nr:hypothetical protein C464_17302 [Halorubrum coriense DSM 10284]